jgi:hypothetical protein
MFQCVDHVDGSFNNVVGLPTEAVREALTFMGWQLPPDESDSRETGEVANEP